MTSPTQTLNAAAQAALGTEYAAVFYYGALGPQLTDPGHIAVARTFEEQHRELRDRTAAALVAAGQSPAPPQTDYPLPFPWPARWTPSDWPSPRRPAAPRPGDT